MNCSNSVTTDTGTFTFHAEFMTRCEAKKKCKSLGQILAPLRKKSDLIAIEKWLKGNGRRRPGCQFVWQGPHYHVGLDVQSVGGKYIREFTDGHRWDDCEGYTEYWDVYQGKNRCPLPLYTPMLELGEAPLSIGWENWDCSPRKEWVMCLDPKVKTSALQEPLRAQQSDGDASRFWGIFAAVSLMANVACVVVMVSMKRVYSKRLNESS